MTIPNYRRRPPVPLSLARFRGHPLVAEVSDEREGPGNPGDGIWVYLQRGYCWGEVHSLHEDTVQQLREAWRDITPCGCADCRGEGGARMALPQPWPEQ
jgi:hypothetical protein